jgi:hypothetical protein
VGVSGSADCTAPSAKKGKEEKEKRTYFQAHVSSRVFVSTLRCATWLILARASPRKPYVPREERSSKALIFEVVKRSHRMGRSDFCGEANGGVDVEVGGISRNRKGGRTRIPVPLSWICSDFSPPSLTVTLIDVAPASSEFSMSSLRAFEGRWMICRSRKRVRREEGRRKRGQAHLSSGNAVHDVLRKFGDCSWSCRWSCRESCSA